VRVRDFIAGTGEKNAVKVNNSRKPAGKRRELIAGADPDAPPKRRRRRKNKEIEDLGVPLRDNWKRQPRQPAVFHLGKASHVCDPFHGCEALCIE
jgi:hypothetical protein